jgi:O-antigen/teichoic acid export membrane protein
MKYVAYTEMAAGISLTALSVVVLLLGYRLVPLVSVYLVGRVLGLALAGYYLVRYFITPRPSLNGAFVRQALVKGAPFFYPSFIYSISQRVGIVMLSKLGGDARVGIYGAASEIVDRLAIIPEGLSGAFFPTLIRLYRDSADEARRLFRKLYGYSALVGLPIAVGGALTAPQIIEIIYGRSYGDSVVVFQLLMGWLLLRFFNSLASWTLGAIHREKLGAVAILTSTPIFLVLAGLTIPHGGQVALASSVVVLELLCFVLYSLFVRRVFSSQLFEPAFFLKVAAASALMGAAVWAVGRFVPFGKWVLLLSIPAGAAVYAALILGLRAVTVEELRELRRTLREKPS